MHMTLSKQLLLTQLSGILCSKLYNPNKGEQLLLDLVEITIVTHLKES